MWDLIKELISRLQSSEFMLADTLNKAFSFYFAVLHILEMWSLKSRLLSGKP